MKRKLALLLAGCLAISPAAAGMYSTQTYAAEADGSSELSAQSPLVVVVKDLEETTLEQADDEADTAKYTLTAGETNQLTALIEQGPESPVLSVWSSETPDIISIDDDGVITAISAGTGRITLSISYDAQK